MSYRHNADFSFVGSRDLYNKYVIEKCCLKMRQLIPRRSIIATAFVCLTFFLSSLLNSSLTFETASAQTRVDLEDLSVKGELLNDNRLRMSSRESTRIQDRVKYRKNFRPEIIDGSDVRVPAAEVLDEVEAK